MPDPFTDEDRAEVEKHRNALAIYGARSMASYQLLILRLAAHIDHLEGALREIANATDPGGYPTDTARLARAALRTSEDAD